MKVFVIKSFLVFAIASFAAAANNRIRGRGEEPSRYLQDEAEIIDGAFIVELSENVTDIASTVTSLLGLLPGAELLYVYEHALKGFAVGGVAEGLIGTLRSIPLVTTITQDTVVRSSSTTQSPATWGLDRVDAATGLDNSYTYDADGSDVHAYVLDTGVLSDAGEFGSRLVQPCRDIVGDGCDNTDSVPHGTHVAGTIGSTTWGVAKNVFIHSVKVLSASGGGSSSGVIAGVDYCVDEKRKNPNRKMLGNLSLGGGANSALDRAVNNAVAAGVPMIVAAGNDNRDACNTSPARASGAITVGATSNDDSRAPFSNYGSCVDIFAPGVAITSTQGGGGTLRLSGTSMAAPHVAGVVAMYLENGKTTDDMLEDGTSNVVKDPNGSPNLMVFSSLAADEDSLPSPSPPTPSPMTPSPTPTPSQICFLIFCF